MESSLRETALAENIPGGYNTVYPAFKTMEESGWTRRGMFVAGLGAAQFAMPAAVDMLRSLRTEPAAPEVVYLGGDRSRRIPTARFCPGRASKMETAACRCITRWLAPPEQA